jgi:hypothetical protein
MLTISADEPVIYIPVDAQEQPLGDKMECLNYNIVRKFGLIMQME